MPDPVFVKRAELLFPANADAPIAATWSSRPAAAPAGSQRI
jgi:hypothetical protein